MVFVDHFVGNWAGYKQYIIHRVGHFNNLGGEMLPKDPLFQRMLNFKRIYLEPKNKTCANMFDSSLHKSKTTFWLANLSFAVFINFITSLRNVWK